jgi:hypothetical protein
VGGITVDGVSLDAFTWRTRLGTQLVGRPASRVADVALSGAHGIVPSLLDPYEAQQITLRMGIYGSTPDGEGSGAAELERNVDALLGLFPSGRLVELRREQADGTWRAVEAKVSASVMPDVRPGVLAEATVVLTAPGVFWRDPDPVEWSQAAPVSGTVYDVAPLTGATAPITDALVLVTGPGGNPQVTDDASGSWVRFDGALGIDEQVRFDPATFSAVRGVGIGWDGAGTDVTGQVSNGGPGSGSRWLHLVPAVQGVDPRDRRVSVSLTAASMTTGSALAVRARRAWL